MPQKFSNFNHGDCQVYQPDYLSLVGYQLCKQEAVGSSPQSNTLSLNLYKINCAQCKYK